MAVGGWRRLAVGGWRSLGAVLNKKRKTGIFKTTLSLAAPANPYLMKQGCCGCSADSLGLILFAVLGMGRTPGTCRRQPQKYSISAARMRCLALGPCPWKCLLRTYRSQPSCNASRCICSNIANCFWTSPQISSFSTSSSCSTVARGVSFKGSTGVGAGCGDREVP